MFNDDFSDSKYDFHTQLDFSSGYDFDTNFSFNDEFANDTIDLGDYNGRMQNARIGHYERSIKKCDETLERLKSGTDTVDDRVDDYNSFMDVDNSIEFWESKKAENIEGLRESNSEKKGENPGENNNSEAASQSEDE